MRTYNLRNMPDDLWKTAQYVRADLGISFRELMLRAIKDFCVQHYANKKAGKI